MSYTYFRDIGNKLAKRDINDFGNYEDVNIMSCYRVYDESKGSNNAPTSINNELGLNNVRGTVMLDFSGASCNMFNSST